MVGTFLYVHAYVIFCRLEVLSLRLFVHGYIVIFLMCVHSWSLQTHTHTHTENTNIGSKNNPVSSKNM